MIAVPTQAQSHHWGYSCPSPRGRRPDKGNDRWRDETPENTVL